MKASTSMTIRIVLFTIVLVVATLSSISLVDAIQDESVSRRLGAPQGECVPCSGSSISFDTSMGGSRRGRQLKFFSKLRDDVKDALTPRSGSMTSKSSTDFMLDTFITSDFFVGISDITVGRVFSTINSNSTMQIGGFALALIIILPLIALEVTSIVTQTPIICILNLSDTTPFMGPCSDFDRKGMRRRLGSHKKSSRQLDETFLQSYFNGTVDSLRIPDMDATDSNVTIELMKIVDYGLSDGVFDIMNNVTITNVINEIANSNTTRPFLRATVFAILPVLIMNRRDEANTPPVTSCTGRNCTRHSRSLSASSFTPSIKDPKTVVATAVSVDDACEMEYIQCQIQNILVVFKSLQ